MYDEKYFIRFADELIDWILSVKLAARRNIIPCLWIMGLERLDEQLHFTPWQSTLC